MAADPNLQALCVKTFERQRSCTAAFIPALVAARVAADRPAGIAARDRREGRARLVAEALEEWKADSTDAAIAKGCREKVARLPPGEAPPVAVFEACLAKASCADFVACLIPAISRQLR